MVWDKNTDPRSPQPYNKYNYDGGVFLKKRWILLPVAILVFLGVTYWLIGKIQYRLNVMDVEDYEPVFNTGRSPASINPFKVSLH
ncbi:MAG: hypothetical protein WDN75_15305 [Bacteroidota bacterium]